MSTFAKENVDALVRALAPYGGYVAYGVANAATERAYHCVRANI